MSEPAVQESSSWSSRSCQRKSDGGRVGHITGTVYRSFPNCGHSEGTRDLPEVDDALTLRGGVSIFTTVLSLRHDFLIENRIVRTNMMNNEGKLMDLNKAIQELLAERARLDDAIERIESFAAYRLGMADPLGYTSNTPPAKRRGRKSMSPVEREEVAARMRKYWADRRANGQSS